MKSVISVVLLLFVVASLAYLLVGESRSPSAGDGPRTEIAASAVLPQDAHPADGQAAVPEQGHAVIAYYFHGEFRCKTCLAMQAYAREAVEEGFAEALKTGALEWQAVDYDIPENQHFVSEYQLTASAVVLAELQDGDQIRWLNLDRIWELVSDEQKYKQYVVEQVTRLLESGS